MECARRRSERGVRVYWLAQTGRRGAHLQQEHEDSAQLGGARDRGKPLLAQQRGERHGGQLAHAVDLLDGLFTA